MEEPPPLRDPGRVVAAAYGLALVCLFVPIAVVGALFAGVALARRNRPAEGVGVALLGIVCTAIGIALFR